MTAPAVPDDLAHALADRYDVRGILGRGGMATVYNAFDRKHHRDVAVKVLRPDIASTIGADRFLKEIEIVAGLVHPHILALHDSGEAQGFVYYVMPFISGGSLRDVLSRAQPVGVERAIEIAVPIADALSYAHQKGVLHRDIKPENVLFAGTHPIVADFGIAKAVSSATSGAQLTRTGISLGTPGYMSPEQAAGFAEVDARTDVYSLAVLVYEMVVGEIPGRWVTEESTRVGKFVDAPAPHRPRLSAAGATIESALVRALALRPDQRTGTPAAFTQELRGQATVRRKYRPDEIEAIVNRAAEIDANANEPGSMTMGGVEQIARDVGIQTQAVRAAAWQLSPRVSTREAKLDAPKKNILIGGPTRLLHQRVIQGELSEADFPILVDEIRVIIGEVGQVSQLGHSFTWVVNKGSSGIRNIEVGVTVRSGRTRITIQESLGQLIGVVFGAIGGGAGGGGMGPMMGILFGALHFPGVAAAFLVPAWLTLVYSVARTTYHYAVDSRDKKLTQLMDRLAAVTEELIGGEPESGRLEAERAKRLEGGDGK